MKHQKLFTLLVLGMYLITGCRNFGGNGNSECSELLLESFTISLWDSMTVHPYSVMDIYTKMRENTTDSIRSYALLKSIGDCYFWAGMTDSAIMILQKVMAYCERAEPTPCISSLQAEAHFKYGIRMAQIRQIDSAIVYYEKARDLELKSNKRDNLLLKIYICLANNYQLKSDYLRASYYFQRVLLISDSLKVEEKFRYNTYLSLADIYLQFDNFDMAEYYLGKAENDLDEQSESSKSYFWSSKGEFCLQIKDYRCALNYLFLDYNYLRSNEYSVPDELALAAANIGSMYLKLGQVDSARHFLALAEGHYEQSPEMPVIKFTIDGYYATLAIQEKKLSEAEKLLTRTYDTLLIESSVIMARHRNLEALYVRKNDFKNAYRYRLKVDAYNDSLRNTKTRNHIEEMEMRYRQDTTLLRKDLRIATVEKRASRWQNIASICLLALMLFATATAAFVLYSRRKREQEYRRQVAIVTGLRMEIVRNRVSPHFVFNALSVMLPSLDQHKELERPFRLLIEMLRNNLRASERLAVSLEEETNLVKNFLQLQEIGKHRNIKVHWQMADDVPPDVRIPSMSIQIPVENAVKYAFTSEQEDASIEIHISRQTNLICIEIDDNGVGFHQAGSGAFSERGTGNGLKMLRRTVELLNTRNQYQMAFSIENKNSISDDSHGTRVSIIVPMEYKFEV